MNLGNETPRSDLVRETRRIPSDTPGVNLQLINRRPGGHDAFTPGRTVVLMHGATFPSSSLFDVPVDGASFMDVLASSGFDVWAVDARGYGGSTRPPEMDRPAIDSEPLTRATTAARDLQAAVEFVCGHRGIERTHLLGMSWGGTVAGLYVSRSNHRIERLVLVAPLWLSTVPLRIDGGGPIANYRLADVRAYEAAWRGSAPEGKRAGLMPAAWFDAWVGATLATDPGSPKPGSVRAPGGAIADVREHWTAGQPLYDPAAITRPVLVMRGDWDVDVNRDMAGDLFDKLINASSRRYVEIGEGTHMLLMEKNRGHAFDATVEFLREDLDPRTV